MKRLLSIGLLWLSLLIACNGNKQAPEPVEGLSSVLSAVDSLMWQQPDSALALLQDYLDCRDVSRNVSENDNGIQGDVSGNVSTTEYDRHYANLLLAELLYKNDYPQTNRCELQQAVVYFDSLLLVTDKRRVPAKKAAHTCTFLAARAHYINGVGYYEHDSVVEACKEYMKALEVMEEHFDEDELAGHMARFMAMTHTRLTTLFSDLYLHEQAIYFGKVSLHYYNKYDVSPHHLAWVLNNIGSHYDIMNEYDSAYYYYSYGLNCTADTISLTYRGIVTHIAFLSYKMGKPTIHSLNQLHKLLEQSEDNVEYVSRCLTIGEIYYHEHQLDSAYYYLEIVYEQTQSAGAKKQAAEWLSEIAEAHGRNAKALEYASFLVPFANLEENQSGIKSQLTALYNEYKQVGLEHQQHQEAQKRIRLWGCILGVLFLVIFLFVYRNIRHRKALEIERHAHQMQQAALSGRLKRSNAELKEQRKWQTTAPPAPAPRHPYGVEDYLDEPICKHILDVCNDKSNPIKSTVPVSAYANIALSDNQKAQLKDAAMRHYGQLFETLRHFHPKLKGKDYLYCYLSLLGLDNVQIAVLQQNSISTIWDRENRLKKIFGSDDKVSVILFGFINNQ